MKLDSEPCWNWEYALLHVIFFFVMIPRMHTNIYNFEAEFCGNEKNPKDMCNLSIQLR